MLKKEFFNSSYEIRFKYLSSHGINILSSWKTKSFIYHSYIYISVNINTGFKVLSGVLPIEIVLKQLNLFYDVQKSGGSDWKEDVDVSTDSLLKKIYSFDY